MTTIAHHRVPFFLEEETGKKLAALLALLTP